MKFLNKIFTVKLSLILLVSFGFFNNLLICYGEDGHIEIKTSINSVCSENKISIDNNEYNIHSSIYNVTPDHCGACQDVLFSFLRYISPKKYEKKSNASSTPVLLENFKSMHNLSDLKNIYFSYHTSSQLIKQIHSQILLI